MGAGWHALWICMYPVLWNRAARHEFYSPPHPSVPTLLVAQSCPTLLWPHGLYSRPGFSVRGLLQVRKLEWVAISSSRGSSQPRNRTQISFIGDWWKWWVLYDPSHQGSPLFSFKIIFVHGWLLWSRASYSGSLSTSGYNKCKVTLGWEYVCCS